MTIALCNCPFPLHRHTCGLRSDSSRSSQPRNTHGSLVRDLFHRAALWLFVPSSWFHADSCHTVTWEARARRLPSTVHLPALRPPIHHSGLQWRTKDHGCSSRSQPSGASRTTAGIHSAPEDAGAERALCPKLHELEWKGGMENTKRAVPCSSSKARPPQDSRMLASHLTSLFGTIATNEEEASSPTWLRSRAVPVRRHDSVFSAASLPSVSGPLSASDRHFFFLVVVWIDGAKALVSGLVALSVFVFEADPLFVIIIVVRFGRRASLGVFPYGGAVREPKQHGP